ncbi:membrane-bound PQQ-dependent dehydrogenase, glucose/quinate/shikimate family [Sphingomonas sp. VDB2]|uniref:membrane-bound PQQ-dependent dehydrogenase, glucose/quinate/shikimate family n=1 Tax=Sphingomonas sp. VDB2 TaxID=3228751 RepID=UPI003A809236
MNAAVVPSPERRGFRACPYLFALLLLSLGIVLAWGGLSLVRLGGSPYYLLAGLTVIASAVLVGTGRHAGAKVYGVMLAATLAWSIWESGFDGWALTARLAAPTVLGLWFLMPWTRRKLAGDAPWSWPTRIGIAVAALLLGATLNAAFGTRPVDPLFQTGMAPVPVATMAAVPAQQQVGDWASYGNDAGGTRFSPLAQITPANVGDLQPAWTYRFGPAPAGAPRSLQVTPIKVGDTLYACTSYNDIVALDAETGHERWRYGAHTDVSGVPHGACRGVSYYRVPGAVGACAARIFTNTIDARLIAVDAATGKPCQDFGHNGIVSLQEGMPKSPKGYYYVSSAPTIARGRIVLGGWVFDNMYWGEPSGVIRAFDAVTGRLSWAFDIGRPDRKGAPPPGETYTPSTPNSWAPMSVDDKLGLIYAPLGGAVLDYAGHARRPFDDAWSGSVVALDAETGTPRWKFQTVHHDLWDYDVASQPTLVDLPMPGGVRHALIQPTKRGEMFVLDRETGKPLYPVTEHAAPTRGAVPGERPSPSQPYSDAMPSFRGPLLTEQSMWGVTPLDQLWCRIAFREARYDGPLTPPGFTPNIVSPGFLGGSDWGSVSIDADRHLMIVNSNRMANYIKLIARATADKMGIAPADLTKTTSGEGAGYAALKGTPVAVKIYPFLSPIFAPCQAPPWGNISAVDLVTGKLVWTHRLGTARDSGPLGLSSMLPFRIGVPNMGGAVTTRGGLFFLAATQDRYLRAFDTATGEVLWRSRLPAGGQSTPMTYLSSRGRQMVAVAAGGHPMMNTRAGDYLIAYALPAKAK